MENAHNYNYIGNSFAKPIVIHKIKTTAALRWLRLAVRDYASAPVVSIIYGGLFALLSYTAFNVGISEPRLALTFFTALVLSGPILATGLYKVAQRRGKQQTSRPGFTPLPSRKQFGQLAVYLGIMLLLAVAWIRITTIAVAVYMSQAIPGEDILISLITSSDGIYFMMLLGTSMFLFALFVFTLSAVGLPMILDGKAAAVTAMITSIRIVANQPRAMFFWASLITVLTLAGIATLFAGLVLFFPLLGYATWHGYQDLLKQDTQH